MRALLGILAAALVVEGCGRAGVGPAPQNGDYKLYTATSTQTSQVVSVIDTRSHAVERNLPSGTPSPDWTHLYAVQGATLIDLLRAQLRDFLRRTLTEIPVLSLDQMTLKREGRNDGAVQAELRMTLHMVKP